MNSHALRAGDELREPGSETARWQVVDPIPRKGRVKVFDSQAYADVYKPFAEINAAISSGSLVLKRPKAPRVSLAAQLDPVLQSDLARLQRHLAQVQALQEDCHTSWARAYALARKDHEKHEAADPFPSRATIYRCLKRQRNGLPLLRGDKNKGNRLPRHSQGLRDLIVREAQARYLRPETNWSFNDLARYIIDCATDTGLLPPGRTVSRAFIRKVIREELSADPEIHRLDPKQVPAAKSIGARRIRCASPFARVEQDGLHLPFVVQTPGGVASNVYLLHAIDCCTGLPVGWHLVIGGVSESDGLKCVESILYSKQPHFDRLGLSIDLDVHGTPAQLVFDNGPETRGERMGRLVQLGIDVMHCKSHHAHGKPFIERLNRSLKEALQTLPGCTRVDGRDGQRDPVAEGDRLMTLEELEHWLVRWYYDDWANTPLERHWAEDLHGREALGITPRTRWQEMTQELAYVLPLSPSIHDWRRTLYEHEERTLSRKTGITCRGFNYKGEHLPYLVNKYGEKPVRILVDPDDYRQIFVDEGDDRPLVALTEEFVDETTPAYSFSYVQEQRKASLGLKESLAKGQFRRDVHSRAIEADGQRARKKPSKTERNREAAKQHKQRQAQERAIARPLLTSGAEPNADNRASTAIDLDSVAPLPVLNRNDGQAPK